MNRTDVETIFTYHPPKDEETKNLYADIRVVFREVALALYDDLRDGPEKTLAIRKLQEAMMYANASIAIHG